MWERINKFLTRVEKKGFNAANKLHEWTINVILASLVYGTYTFLRDYNQFFLDARVKFIKSINIFISRVWMNKNSNLLKINKINFPSIKI